MKTCSKCEKEVTSVADDGPNRGVCYTCIAKEQKWCVQCYTDGEVNDEGLCQDCTVPSFRQFLNAREHYDNRVKSLAKTLAGLLKMQFARDFAKLEYNAYGDKLTIEWKEYFRGEFYSHEMLDCPVEFLTTSPEEIEANLAACTFKENR
jgi:hypothetical protein